MQMMFTLGGVIVGILIAVRRSILAWIQKGEFDDNKVNKLFVACCKVPLPTNFKEAFIKLNSLNIYEEKTLKVTLIYRMFENTTVAAIFLFAVLVMNNNFVHFVTLLPIVYMFCESIMQQFVDSTYTKFLGNLDLYCQRLTTSYNRTFNVSKTMEEVVASGMLKKFSIEMTNMCYENDVTREKLYDLRSMGHPIVLQLAEIVRTCANLGVSSTSIDKSPFMVNMLRFTEYVQNELHICENRSSKFGINKYILFAIALYYAYLPLMIINWFSTIEHVFNGVQGLVQRLIFVIIWSVLFICSEENAKCLLSREMDISVGCDLFVEKFRPFVELFITKSQRKVDNIKLKLLKAASYKTIAHYYASKVMYGIQITIAVFLIFISGLSITRSNIYVSTASFGETGNFGLTEDNTQEFIEADQYFIDLTDKEFNALSNDEIITFYEGNIPGVTHIQAERCASRIKHKISAYKETEIPMFFPMIMVLTMIFSYFIPDIQLKLREINKKELRRMDIDCIMNMLVLYSYTTMIVDNVITELANMLKILNVELVFMRETSGEYKENYVERQKHVGEDLALIYDKFYAMETSLTIKEAMSNIPGIIDSRRQTTNYNINKQMEQMSNIFAILFLLPMLYITMAILVTPMMNVSLNNFTEAMSLMVGS